MRGIERGVVSDTVCSPNVFGGCPVCGGNDGFVNVGRMHWFVCDKHRTKWCIGSNWFRCSRFDAEVWQENLRLLSKYREVTPVLVKEPKSDRGKAALPNDVLTAIESIIEYLWDDEHKHCLEAENESAKRHIFGSLVTIRNWLDGNTRTIDSWLEED